MKGTLFSADFIKDSNDNLRLLELNTDTAISNAGLVHIDYTEFISLLSESNIDTLVVIHKQFQDNFVNNLASYVNTSAPFITSFQTIVEEASTVYPTVVEDASNKFILRLAYDASAIFDSTYAANSFNTLNLFSENNNTDSIPGYYFSSSVEGVVVDSLNSFQNSVNIPDVVLKDTNNVHSSLQFIKVGGTGSLEENFTTLKQGTNDSKLLLNFYNDETSSKVSSIRNISIIYSNNGLQTISLCNFEADAVFEKPTSITYDSSNVKNILDEKHYFEFSTNYPKINTEVNAGGIFEEETITDISGSGVLVKDVVVGEKYKSYYIEGSPDSDLPVVFTAWSASYNHEGNGLPSGSYETGSTLVNSFVQPLDRKMISNITVTNNSGSASFRISPAQHLLVHEQETDLLKYKMASSLVTGSDNLVRLNGDIIGITSNITEILDGEYSTVVLDLEPGDTFFLHDTELNIKVVTHNCFPEGTLITLSNGDVKNIEDVTNIDDILTYNIDNNSFGEGNVGNVRISTQNNLILIETENGESIKSTPLHKFYVNGKWVSAKDIKIGDILINKDIVDSVVSNVTPITGEFKVFHLIDVSGNHTYFANNILVHNIKIGPPSCFSAGTLITLSNHDEKFIEDVMVGDEVLGWNGTELVPAKVIRLDNEHTVGSHAAACKQLGDAPSLYTINDTGIEFTPEHPFLTKEGWKSLVPDPNQEPYKTEQEPKVLKVGDFINRNGDWEEVDEIRVVRSNPDERVYNLVIDKIHSYIADGIIVHNKL